MEAEEPLMKDTLVINILGGPGVGKTTLASELFTSLKKRGKDVEIVSEFAKELVWEKRQEAFGDRLYMHAEQNHRLLMMKGELDYIITDSPLILTSVYNRYYLEDVFPSSYNNMIDEVVTETWKMYRNVTFLLEREGDYDTNGRRENSKEANDIDKAIHEYIKKNRLEVHILKDRDGAVDEILRVLDL